MILFEYQITGLRGNGMKRNIFVWEPWFFIAFGLFHLHRVWGFIDRNSYAGFWLAVLENKGVFYFVLTGILGVLCILGVATFVNNRYRNYWWRWIYLFGGMYLLFDLFAIATGLEFWNKLLVWMFDVTSIYWNIIWSFFILLGGFVFVLGITLLMQRKQYIHDSDEEKF